MHKDIARLQHDMGGIAVAFEMMIRGRMPKDGSLDDDFEMWKDMFFAAVFAPHHAMAVQSAHDALAALLTKLTTNPIDSPRYENRI